MTGVALLSAERIGKAYGATTALDDVSLSVRSGTVHGLMGGNGAGKSTLMKIISAAVHPDRGQICWRGEPARWRRPQDAVLAGVGTVYQHIPLAPSLTVLENVFLGRRRWRRRDRAMVAKYDEVSSAIGYNLHPDSPVADLSIGQRQMVAIMHTLAADASLIILDEPTASLASRERHQLFETLAQLRAAGTSMLYCSHFIGEVRSVTDEVTVLRNGRVVLSEATSEITEHDLAEAVAGRTLYAMEQSHPAAPPTVSSHVSNHIVRARDLKLTHSADPADLDIAPGEIVGVAGLMGSGRTRLLRALFGDLRPEHTSFTLSGQPYPTTVRHAIQRNVAYLPEDRDTAGLISGWEIWRNLSLPYLATSARRGVLLDPAQERKSAGTVIDQLSIKARSPDALVSELSGGNAQKVSIGRWFREHVSLLLLDEPTVGVDIGARIDILEAIRTLASDNGAAVVIVSSDFEELLAVSHRVLVMRKGSIVHDFDAHKVDESDLLTLVGANS